MKIVLDTNVLVSAFLKPQSDPAKILRLILQRNFQIVINEHILSEYYEVLKRPKFSLDPSYVQVILQFIRKIGVNAPALRESFSLPDSGDIPFLEAAMATRADALITGNNRHFPDKFCKGQKVVTPTEFLSMVHGSP